MRHRAIAVSRVQQQHHDRHQPQQPGGTDRLLPGEQQRRQFEQQREREHRENYAGQQGEPLQHIEQLLKDDGRQPFDRSDQMQRAAEREGGNRVDENRFFEQLAEVIDAEHVEEHLQQKQQQPKQAGEQRRLGQQQFVAPCVREKRAVRKPPSSRLQPALHERQCQQPKKGQEQRQREALLASDPASRAVDGGAVMPSKIKKRERKGGYEQPHRAMLRILGQKLDGNRDEDRHGVQREQPSVLGSGPMVKLQGMVQAEQGPALNHRCQQNQRQASFSR